MPCVQIRHQTAEVESTNGLLFLSQVSAQLCLGLSSFDLLGAMNESECSLRALLCTLQLQ